MGWPARVHDAAVHSERLTQKASAAQGAYDERQNPVRDCRAFATPSLVTLPYLQEIEIQDDRILMRSEFFKVERTIYVDGRGHPRDQSQEIT